MSNQLNANPNFNPRPRAEGGGLLKQKLGPAPDFNPRPRAEGGAGNPKDSNILAIISTHALVQRAALAALTGGVNGHISTHALVQRAARL